MKIRKEYTCPLEICHDILKGKWKTVILYQINHKEKYSLSGLVQDINGITEKVLLDHLKDLIKWGLVDKYKYQGYPLRVEYSLTERGNKIIPALEIMQEVGNEILNDIKNKSIPTKK